MEPGLKTLTLCIMTMHKLMYFIYFLNLLVKTGEFVLLQIESRRLWAVFTIIYRVYCCRFIFIYFIIIIKNTNIKIISLFGKKPRNKLKKRYHLFLFLFSWKFLNNMGYYFISPPLSL